MLLAPVPREEAGCVEASRPRTPGACAVRVSSCAPVGLAPYYAQGGLDHSGAYGSETAPDSQDQNVRHGMPRARINFAQNNLTLTPAPSSSSFRQRERFQHRLTCCFLYSRPGWLGRGDTKYLTTTSTLRLSGSFRGHTASCHRLPHLRLRQEPDKTPRRGEAINRRPPDTPTGLLKGPSHDTVDYRQPHSDHCWSHVRGQLCTSSGVPR